MENKSPWPLAFKFGLILALSYMAISMIFHLISPQDGTENWSVSNIIQTLLLFILDIYILFIAGKIRRDQDFEGIINYNKSLGFMMVTSIPSLLIIMPFIYLFFTYINPELVQKIWDMQAEEIAKSSRSDEEAEQAIKLAKMFTGPITMAIAGGFMKVLQLLVCAFIASIFVKKEPKTFE